MNWAALLLLPGVLLLGLCAGENNLFPNLQSGWEGGTAVGGRAPALSLDILEEAVAAADLPSSLGSGLAGDLLEPDCRELLVGFANSSVRMTDCLVRSARPVTLCQNCYIQYRELTERFDNITGAVGNTTESNNCAKSLLMSDRLQIVVILSGFFTDTWTKANCANCLKKNSEGLSNDTVKFLALFNESLACFEHNLQQQEDDLLSDNYTEVCKKCNVTYKNLNVMYIKMQKSGQQDESEEHSNLCIDVEDAMNITRRLWSTTFNCSVPCSDTVPVIAVSSFILFLPVVFYLSSFLHSKQKKRILIMTKRFQSNSSYVNIQEKFN